MAVFSRWLAPTVLAASLGVAGFTPTAHAQSGDELVRVIVDVADVIMRGGQPYYRHGDYRHADRLVVGRDRYGRPVYYRQGGYANPYRGGYGYERANVRRQHCNKHGKCKVEYYDPRYDRRHDRAYSRGYDRYDRYRGHDRYNRDYDRYYGYDGRR